MAFECFCLPLSGEFDHKFCPTLQTFEFDCAESWVHLDFTMQSIESKTHVPGGTILEIISNVKLACFHNYYYSYFYNVIPLQCTIL